MLEKVINLKEKIEKEIIEINNLYETVNNKLTKAYEEKFESIKKSYDEKYENLTQIYKKECDKIKKEYEDSCDKFTKEENDLKLTLEDKVTKVKEKLENYLINTNNIIKFNEKVNKGIKILSKFQERNIIKNLLNIFKINKNKKEAKSLFQEPMKNLNISFNIENNCIIYDEYYFNGVSLPKNIEFLYCGSFEIKWSIDKNKYKNQIKYKVEMKKGKEDFNQIYEGNNTICSIENIIVDIDYDFRICSICNDIISPWAEIKKIKSINFFKC